MEGAISEEQVKKQVKDLKTSILEVLLCNYKEMETLVMAQVVFVGLPVNQGLKFHKITKERRSSPHLNGLL